MQEQKLEYSIDDGRLDIVLFDTYVSFLSFSWHLIHSLVVWNDRYYFGFFAIPWTRRFFRKFQSFSRIRWGFSMNHRYEWVNLKMWNTFRRFLIHSLECISWFKCVQYIHTNVCSNEGLFSSSANELTGSAFYRSCSKTYVRFNYSLIS